MGILVVSGATITCAMGAAPAVLQATGQQKFLGCSKPAATVMDAAAFVNIPPCGMCSSPTNPAIAPILSSTGVLVPQPCTPQPAGTWIPTQMKLLAGGAPCLANDSQLICAFGGVLTITDPGQTKIIIG